ncbi:hypothetical protein FHS29_000476 [Saccharothrix tamanrassetensis]|uniref:Uncharacterized protein n=1 Tax=Saccharothrix tamanrassetensis TaxID=1051531 RepID=A0A841CDS1_9PSEU|nr:hypothetical protein [Saccharothrix tamanrassetensis]MBB5953906.1 hypothetical protein [Saccharothrix tamanrassetensis]
MRDAVHVDPVTDARVWFDHAAMFPVTTLPDAVRRGLREVYADEPYTGPRRIAVAMAEPHGGTDG